MASEAKAAEEAKVAGEAKAVAAAKAQGGQGGLWAGMKGLVRSASAGAKALVYPAEVDHQEGAMVAAIEGDKHTLVAAPATALEVAVAPLLEVMFLLQKMMQIEMRL